jgi:hypothetical protein
VWKYQQLREVDWWCKSNRHARSICASKSMFAQMIAVDVLVANLWMGFYFMELKNQIKLTNG